MRYSVLYFIFNLMSLLCLAQNDNKLDKSLLWEISKIGLNHKSYLIGTHHGGTKNNISYSTISSLPQFNKILDSVDAIGVECDFADTTFIKMVADNINNCIFKRYPESAFLPDSINDISQLFEDTTEYDFVCTTMSDFKSKKFPFADDYNRLKPAFTIQMINQFMQMLRVAINKKRGVINVSMDAGIYEEARRLEKCLFFMESAEYHVNLLNKTKLMFVNSMTLQEQAEGLYSFCKDFKDPHSASKSHERQQEELYLKEDLNGMQNLDEKVFFELRKRPEFSVIDKDIVIGRNKNWISVITSYIDNKSCLIAVGALHLPGENGLINLLRKQGYDVNPIGLFEK